MREEREMYPDCTIQHIIGDFVTGEQAQYEDGAKEGAAIHDDI